MKKSKSRKAVVKRAKVAPRKKAKIRTVRKALRGGTLSRALANAHIRQNLIDIAGENALHVIKEFKKNMSDDELARKTKLKVSDVRVVLNRLHNQGLAKYYRNRDKDSGWYSYVWCFEEDKLALYGKAAGASKSGVEFEGDRYMCASCGPETVVAFDAATDVQFRCQSCGGGLVFVEKK